MLTDHEPRREYDLPHEGEPAREHDGQMTFPVLAEPTWLEDDELEELEAPRDSAFRGIWIGIVAAAVTFVLVFAIPHWLGWYEVGTSTPRAKRDVNPESVVSTVTAKPSGPAAETPPDAVPPRTPAPEAAASKPAAPKPVAPKAVAQKQAVPASPAPKEQASDSDAAFWVQIAAFKNANQANRLAARVKRDGYPAEVRRLKAEVPWVVWVGTYSSRDKAESAQHALAQKGFRGFIR